MSSNENLIFDELYGLLRKLSYLCLESERFVRQFFDEMWNAVSQREIEFQKNLNHFIEDYKNMHSLFKVRVENLEVKLSRTNFQIFIYGQVSVGKSKIINAILGEDILQSASAHTTSCFVKICKSSDEYHHIEYRDIKKSYAPLNELKNEIKNLSTTNSVNPLKNNELLSVYLNIPENKILTSNTEIIDCPGSANKESITNFIRQRGLQADVFIFVLTSEITENDKTYFRFQSEQSSKPIIFFLVNKWDQAYNEGDDVADDSKKKVTGGLIDFLGKEMKLSENEKKNCIFFISALDICRKRNILSANSSNNDARAIERCIEFESFEETLSKYKTSFIKRIYEENLKEIKIEIISNIKYFKIEFREEINIENIEYIKKLKDFLDNIKTSSERHEIYKEIELIKTNLSSFVKKCEINICRYNIDSIENEFNSLINENSLLKLKIRIERLIDDQIIQCKNITNIVVVKDKHDLKVAMKMEIKLQTISETIWEIFFNLITKIFTILRRNFMQSNKKKDDQILKDNVKEIEDITSKICTESLDPLSRYLATETKKITNSLELKIQAYETFLTNINYLFTT